jgi:hypothetical protein
MLTQIRQIKSLLPNVWAQIYYGSSQGKTVKTFWRGRHRLPSGYVPAVVCGFLVGASNFFRFLGVVDVLRRATLSTRRFG